MGESLVFPSYFISKEEVLIRQNLPQNLLLYGTVSREVVFSNATNLRSSSLRSTVTYRTYFHLPQPTSIQEPHFVNVYLE